MFGHVGVGIARVLVQEVDQLAVAVCSLSVFTARLSSANRSVHAHCWEGDRRFLLMVTTGSGSR